MSSPASPSSKRRKQAFEYEFDEEIAGELNLLENKIVTKHVMTKSNRGYQMNSLNALFDEWVAGCVKPYPVLDIGCAYGLHSLTACFRNKIPVVALDMEQIHLNYVQKHYEKEKQEDSPSLTTVLSSLPELNGIENESVSSILVAEVLHFLNGKELKQSFKRFYDVLIRDGTLCATASSTYVCDFNINREIIERRKKNGEEDPCYLVGEDVKRVLYDCRAAWEEKNPQFKLNDQVRETSDTPMFHLLSVVHLAQLAEDAGFVIKLIRQQKLEGYPQWITESHTRGKFSNVQLVAQKL